MLLRRECDACARLPLVKLRRGEMKLREGDDAAEGV
jgi:hypothetical protein